MKTSHGGMKHTRHSRSPQIDNQQSVTRNTKAPMDKGHMNYTKDKKSGGPFNDQANAPTGV